MGEVYYYFQIYVHKPDTYIGTTWGLLSALLFLVGKIHMDFEISTVQGQ